MLNKHLDPEQQIAVHAIQSGNSVSMNAVFGSGKTTTILESVRSLPQDKYCILVTYNTHLKNEVIQKVKEQQITNLHVFTYHSLSMKYFKFGKNDEELQIHVDTSPTSPLPDIDIMFIDEIQDMTLLLYSFIQKFLSYLPRLPQIVICGDHLQGVYQFKGADKRFLTLGSEIFPNHQTNFNKCQIHTSYRLTQQMGWFINECIYGSPILKTVKQGNPILFFHQNIYTTVKNIISVLQQKPDLKPDDIFVLAPSLKCGKKSPLKLLENMIFEKLGLPIYYCTMEDRELNDEVIKGKVVFSTFHQSKGRERKLVILFGFDESYYEFYAKDESRSLCPSTLIVALSRAKEDLIIVKDIHKRPLPFMKKSIYELSKCPEQIKVIGKLCDVELNDKTPDPKRTEQYKKICVTDLVKYIKIEYQVVISQLKDQLFVKKNEILDDVVFDCFVECKRDDQTLIYEDISDLVGLLIPSIFEERQTGMSKMKMRLIEAIATPQQSELIARKLNHLNLESDQLADWLYAIKVYKAIETGIYSPFQIHDINWISGDVIERMIKNIEFHIQDKQLFEYDFDEDCPHPLYYNHPDFGKIFVSGRMDSLDKNYVWEFKCVKELTLEHFLQVICYQWLWNLILKDKFESRTFRLLNIRTGEMYEMINDSSLVNDVIQLLMINRYSKMISISDEEFVQSCLGCRKLFLRPDS
jgi:hypothetical protein